MDELTIRAAEPSDVEALTRLANLPGVRHGTLRMPFTPRVFMEKRIESAGPNTHVLVGFVGADVMALATLTRQFGRRSHVGEVYLFVHDDHTGQGIGTQMLEALLDLADNWIGLQRVELTVSVDNERAIRLYQQLGFEHEGTQRSSFLRDGVLVDGHMMARLRSAPDRVD